MAYTSQKIIAGVEKNFPTTPELNIKHMSDLEIEYHIKPKLVFQYLIGVTADESYAGGGIRHYEANIKEKLKHYQLVGNSPWLFKGDETDELSMVLSELSEHYNASLDIERVLRKANVKPGNESYYLVITVIAYPIIHPYEEV